MHEQPPLTVGSLFSGIGGIDLGLERAGMVTRWFVEWDSHCQNVLRRHWPGVPVYGDITTVDWGTVEPVDVLAGGFPCQPISSAGKKMAESDERWLWPHFARAIGAIRPRYVLVENVAALLVRGFDSVIGDLAALGYDAEWDCIPAAAIGAPIDREGRDRLWIVAYTDSGGRSGTGISRQPYKEVVARPAGGGRALPWVPSPASDHWKAEPGVGRVADGVPDRVERLRSLGNAVVPQVVEWIGHRIVAFDEKREVIAA